MKEEIVKKANEMRLRPVDVHRASEGLVSQAQASNWLNGMVSAGAAFALRLLCEKIEGGYIVPVVGRKERIDKGVPRRLDWDARAVDNPYVMGIDPCRKWYGSGSVGVSHPDGATTILPDHADGFTDIFGTPSKEKCLALNYAERDVDGVMEMCYAVKGTGYNFGDGEGIYWCQKGDLIGVTHVSMGGVEYPVAKFGKK